MPAMTTPLSLEKTDDNSVGMVALGMAAMAISCVIYWVLLVASFDDQRKDADNQTRQRVVQMANMLSLQTETLLSGLDVIIQGMVAKYETGDTKGFELGVQNTIASLPLGALHQIALADANGRVIYSSLWPNGKPVGEPVFVTDRDHFRAAVKMAEQKETRLFISRPVQGRVSRKWTIQLTRPLRDAHGAFAGAIVVSLSPSYVSGFFQRVFDNPADVVLLARSDGAYLARSDREEESMGRSVPAHREFLTHLDKRQGEYDAFAAIDGVERFYGWTRVENYPVVVSVGLDKRSAQAPTERAIKASLSRNLLGTVVIWIGTICIAWLVRLQQRNIALLARNERRLQKLVAQVPGMIFQYRLFPDGHRYFPYTSPNITEIYGLTPEEVMEDSSPVLTLIHPDDRDRVWNEITESALRLTPWICTYRVQLADGTVRWLEGHANPEPEADGATLWHGYIHDITDRHSTQQALKDSEERLRLAVQAVQDGLWEWRITEDRIIWDRRCYDMLGYPDQSFTLDFSKLAEMIHPLDRDRHKAKMRMALQDGQSYRNEFRVRTALNGWLWVEARGEVVVTGMDGSALKMMGTLSDISQRVTQAQLRRVLLDQSAAVIFLATPDRKISLANARAIELFGPRSGESLVGQSMEVLHADAHSFDAFARFYSILRQDGSVRLEHRLKDGQGQVHWFELHGTLLDPEAPDGSVIWTMFDVDDRHRAETALLNARKRLTAIIDHFPGGVLVEDGAMREVVVANNALCQLMDWGTAPIDLIGRPVNDIATNDATQWLTADASAAHDRKLVGQEHVLSNGRVLEVDRIPLLLGMEHMGVLWVIRDITERKSRETALQMLATTDTLTGLPNRRAFMARMDEELNAIRRGEIQPSTVIMLDLDHFKRVNDTYGHKVGDQVLQHMAKCAQTALRRKDMAGRLGGEEFAVLLSETNGTGAAALAERLREALASSPAHTDAGEITFTASLGIAILDPTSINAQECLAQADQALYEAKHQGRNRVCLYSPASDLP